jgi:hypothetical protein
MTPGFLFLLAEVVMIVLVVLIEATLVLDY